MKKAISPESLSDPGHSSNPQESESTHASSRVKSAAMLGLALSVGASGALVSGSEVSAAVSPSNTPETTKAFSNSSKISAEQSTEIAEAPQVSIVAYHTVESGESLWQIAQQHQVGLRALKFANELPPETAIRVGQVLKVPSSVAATESLASSEAVPTDASTLDIEASVGIVFEEVTPSQPAAVVAQSIDDSVEVDSANNSVQLSSFEITEQSTVEIEIADASSTESEPVVTALATPQSFSSYQIQAGDTLASIASSLGTTTQEIINANGLTNPNIIITGATLRVPSSSEQTLARSSTRSAVSATSGYSGSTYERLSYLQSTATRSESPILGELRSASPAAPVSVGGEVVTEQDVIRSDSSENEAADPFVANLLEDVEAVRDSAVSVSEVSSAADDSVSDRPSLLARASSRDAIETAPADQVAIAPTVTADVSASPELLAAAPLSPDAYIPAQRPSAGQVVSPDMPILPDAGEFLPEAPDYFDGYVWPTQGTVTSGYGWRWGRMHRGVDVAGPVGTPVVAAAMGVVEQAGWNSGGYGNLVEIRHPDGSLTRYAHNNRLNVTAGQTVRQGQQIAEMGSTGYSTGPHLHFEVHVSGQGAVNPVAYLPSR
ncbi:MAG: peptidoglycan DD-metalloendopeptidase family protein [Cyanobacteria bacterium J06621_11]